MLPFYPEVDWSECVVVISEARIVDLPRILRRKTREEIVARQLACSNLYERVLGGDARNLETERWEYDEPALFTFAMRLVRARVLVAFAAEKQAKDLVVGF